MTNFTLIWKYYSKGSLFSRNDFLTLNFYNSDWICSFHSTSHLFLIFANIISEFKVKIMKRWFLCKIFVLWLSEFLYLENMKVVLNYLNFLQFFKKKKCLNFIYFSEKEKRSPPLLQGRREENEESRRLLPKRDLATLILTRKHPQLVIADFHTTLHKKSVKCPYTWSLGFTSQHSK